MSMVRLFSHKNYKFHYIPSKKLLCLFVITAFSYYLDMLVLFLSIIGHSLENASRADLVF